MLERQTFEHEIGGRNLVIATGKVAEQAAAAITVHYGDTLVLVTVCTSAEPRENVDFLPLTVDYEERLYAAGKIPGGFIRREGRPSQEATLASRLTDRAMRPLLPKTWRREIQVVITVLSADQENDPDILALIGGSAALSMSEVPFEGPVGAVRIGHIDGKFVINPTLPQLENSQFEVIVASTKDKVIMLEAGAKEVPESLIIEAIKLGHEVNQGIIKLQEKLRAALGKPKTEAPAKNVNPDLVAAVTAAVNGKVADAFEGTSKSERDQKLNRMQKELVGQLETTYPKKEILAAFDDQIRIAVRTSLLEKRQRLGGRALTEVRPISCEVGLLPRTHGSALFTRGQTQVLNITTLGSTREEQKLDGLGIEETKRFIHHYNFPPFSNGEVGRMGTPGRREIGHGALAERSLLPVIPKEDEFPYTIRLVSEVLSSSGSTSMASVCSSSLSLMDAGVPIKRPVSGIAMGLVTNPEGKYVVLTDIEGLEDNYGDMDFKVAGTTEGITGVQMDTKLKGLTMEIVEKTIAQAKDARLFILDIMNKTISSSRPDLSKYAPRVYKISVPVEKIGAVIGPGGKNIRSIIEETKTTIDISDDGTVLIGSTDEAGAKKAMEIISNMTKEIEVGGTYTGKVTRVLNFGAMIEIMPGKEGLVHISELADYRVASVEDIVKVGDQVAVKVIEVDSMGRINLSRRALLKKTDGPGSEDRPAAPGHTSGPQHRPHPPFRNRPPA
ncbi:MAG: polyribonucleotide nucleotidyltransferase [Dehalococcoidales bacterium]|nr:polyribonucleotide nucleotidyltransferase [Dehalococcoidales bacterium]